MNFAIERWLGVAAGLAAGLALLWYMYGPRIQERIVENQAPEVAQAPAPAPAPADDAPLYPVPELPAAAPGPAAKPAPAPRKAPVAVPEDLAASDGTLRGEIAEIFGEEPIESFLIAERIVQNIVTTVDSLDREPVPLRYRAIGPVSELPVVDHSGDAMRLSEDNGARYAYLVGALERADSHALAAFYLRYYPLFQRAYRDLGYPKGHFNDRVIAIIDHLLATPDVPSPELIRPKVLYQFADPELEERSSGQKTLIRMGSENAAVVKRKLREIRTILAARGKGAAAPSAPGDAAPAPAREDR